MKIGIITPVGPGHEVLALECLNSVMKAWNYSRGKFTAIELIMMPDLEGKFGRSSRRNSGIEEAVQKKCDWLFFLDADDLMSENAFEVVGDYLDDHDAVFGNICEFMHGEENLPKLREPQIKGFSDYLTILLFDPYLTLQMGHFVKTACANSIGFDVEMNAGEDFKYYLSLCEKYRFKKIDSTLFVNRRGSHSSGPLSANGKDWRMAVEGLISNKLKELDLNISFQKDGLDFIFSITNSFDVIQNHLIHGVFYEQDELDFLKKWIKPGLTILDVGANLGNHAVFFLKNMLPSSLYCYEARDLYLNLLEKNLALNDEAHVVHLVDRELGLLNGVVGEGTFPPCDWRALRERFESIEVNFIRFDFDGELDFLEAFGDLIARCKTLVFIKVSKSNLVEFEEKMADLKCHVFDKFMTQNHVKYLLSRT
jgi:hypothetical protein